MTRLRLVLLVTAILAGLAAIPRSSVAATCTLHWVGPAGGNWGTTANWDRGRVPDATDTVCIPAGATVTHSTGSDSISSLQADGQLTISGGTLNLTSTADISTATNLTLSNGTLGGAGRIDLSGTNNVWSGGTMDDGGTTNVTALATLHQRTNNGTLANGRQLGVAGTFALEGNTTVIAAGSAPQITNTGLIQRTTLSGAATINAPLDNDGVVHADTGTLNLAGGTGTGSSSGDYGAAGAGGEINLNTGTHALANGAELLGHVNLTGATVTVPAAATVTASGANTMSNGTLGGAGTFNIPSGAGLTWSGGTMDGGGALPGGATNVAAGATLRQTTNNVTLANRRQLNNAGTFTLDSSTTVIAAGSAPQITNTGLIERTGLAGTTTSINPPLDNQGVIDVRRGTLNLPASLTQTAASTLRVLVTSTTDFGRIALGGTPNLAGTLAVETSPAYQLAVGNQISVVTYSGHTGTFDTVTGLDGANVHYTLTYGTSAVTLTVTSSADTTPPPAPTFTEAPPATTSNKDAVFGFESSEPGVTFSCRLDGGAFEPCTSPKSYTGLPAGAHTFDLMATDSAGNSTMASRTWAVEAGGPKTIEDLPPPVVGVKANVEPVKGTVLIAVPAGGARSASARASQKGLKFVPLEEARQVPVGSFLDTRKGTVRLQSATGAASTTYDGDFAAGLFQVLQSRKKRDKGLTDLVLKGGSFSRCTTARRGKGTAAALSKKTIRSLRSNAKGRFRTRGRHSAATVRGTKWTVADRCDGTLTTVQRGAVEVRDFRRKKTIVVKAGKSYLARAP
jgi:hypothetical protein